MSEKSQDDYIMAALPHAATILPFWGLVASVVIWATQKDKSRFVGFQALQAMVYQLLPIVGGMLFFLCYMCSFGVIFVITPLIGMAASEAGGQAEGPLALLTMLPISLPFCIWGIALLVFFCYVAYALYAAVRVFQGCDFRYAVIGPWLERYMQRQVAAR